MLRRLRFHLLKHGSEAGTESYATTLAFYHISIFHTNLQSFAFLDELLENAKNILMNSKKYGRILEKFCFLDFEGAIKKQYELDKDAPSCILRLHRFLDTCLQELRTELGSIFNNDNDNEFDRENDKIYNMLNIDMALKNETMTSVLFIYVKNVLGWSKDFLQYLNRKDEKTPRPYFLLELFLDFTLSPQFSCLLDEEYHEDGALQRILRHPCIAPLLTTASISIHRKNDQKSWKDIDSHASEGPPEPIAIMTVFKVVDVSSSASLKGSIDAVGGNISTYSAQKTPRILLPGRVVAVQGREESESHHINEVAITESTSATHLNLCQKISAFMMPVKMTSANRNGTNKTKAKLYSYILPNDPIPGSDPDEFLYGCSLVISMNDGAATGAGYISESSCGSKSSSHLSIPLALPPLLSEFQIIAEGHNKKSIKSRQRLSQMTSSSTISTEREVTQSPLTSPPADEDADSPFVPSTGQLHIHSVQSIGMRETQSCVLMNTAAMPFSEDDPIPQTSQAVGRPSSGAQVYGLLAMHSMITEAVSEGTRLLDSMAKTSSRSMQSVAPRMASMLMTSRDVPALLDTPTADTMEGVVVEVSKGGAVRYRDPAQNQAVETSISTLRAQGDYVFQSIPGSPHTPLTPLTPLTPSLWVDSGFNHPGQPATHDGLSHKRYQNNGDGYSSFRNVDMDKPNTTNRRSFTGGIALITRTPCVNTLRSVLLAAAPTILAQLETPTRTGEGEREGEDYKAVEMEVDLNALLDAAAAAASSADTVIHWQSLNRLQSGLSVLHKQQQQQTPGSTFTHEAPTRLLGRVNYNVAFDIDTDILFEILNPRNLITVFLAFLLEQKIAVVSSRSVSAVTILGEFLRAAIMPLKWCHVYTPVLPISMAVNLLQCPAPFFVGIQRHSSDGDISFDLRNVPSDVVIVDLDSDDCRIPSGFARSLSVGRTLVKYLDRILRPGYSKCDDVTSIETSASSHFAAEYSMATSSNQGHVFRSGRAKAVLSLFNRFMRETVASPQNYCLRVDDGAGDIIVLFDEEEFLKSLSASELKVLGDPQSRYLHFMKSLIRSQSFSSLLLTLVVHSSCV